MQNYLLNDYIECLKNEEVLVKMSNIVESNIPVEYVSYDSQEVKANTLFICKGAAFKKSYLEDAIKKGAVAYLSTKDYEVSIPCILVSNIYQALSCVSAMYFDYPGEQLNLIGITGTKGKSTTAYYVKYILDEYAKQAEKKETAIISSIDTYDGVENFESHLTTPESYEIHKHFSHAVESGIENLVMEVSSQALKNYRVHNIVYDIGIFLNISEDHISPIEHLDFEDYFSSKLKLFERSKIALVNLDSDFSERVVAKAKEDSKRVITFSMRKEEADIYAYKIRKENFNTIFHVRTKDFDEEFILTMPGIFNVENALAAIGVAYVMHIPMNIVYEGLKKARSSGRMEVYHTKDQNVIAIVDYAHNKLSFEKLYESVKTEYDGRKIITIFGCPGKKALLRRRDLGTLAGKNSDKVYLVAEDPGAEPVEEISQDIAQYVKPYLDNYVMIEDRGEAIKDAILTAKDKTVILITGKGNETRQKYGTQYLPCKSDVAFVKEYIQEYDKKEGKE